MGKEWDLLGHKDRCTWCISHAVRYAKRLEALIATEQLPPATREKCVLQLFNLYLHATTERTRAKNPSLANNMLAKALQLIRQEVVQPATAAVMSLGISKQQLEQAQEMIKVESSSTATALVLLASAEQHIENALASAQGDETLTAEAQQRRGSVVIATAEAHFAAGEVETAIKRLESVRGSLLKESGFISGGQLLVRALVAVKNVSAAAEMLKEAVVMVAPENSNTTTTTTITSLSRRFLDAWMAAFSTVIHAASGKGEEEGDDCDAVPAVVAAALAFLHAVHAQPRHAAPLLRCMLSAAGGNISQDICMKVLATEEVIVLASGVRVVVYFSQVEKERKSPSIYY